MSRLRAADNERRRNFIRLGLLSASILSRQFHRPHLIVKLLKNWKFPPSEHTVAESVIVRARALYMQSVRPDAPKPWLAKLNYLSNISHVFSTTLPTQIKSI